MRKRYLAHPDRAVWLGAAPLLLVALLTLIGATERLAIDRAWSDAMQDGEGLLINHVALPFTPWSGLGVALSPLAVPAGAARAAVTRLTASSTG